MEEGYRQYAIVEDRQANPQCRCNKRPYLKPNKTRAQPNAITPITAPTNNKLTIVSALTETKRTSARIAEIKATVIRSL